MRPSLTSNEAELNLQARPRLVPGEAEDGSRRGIPRLVPGEAEDGSRQGMPRLTPDEAEDGSGRGVLGLVWRQR